MTEYMRYRGHRVEVFARTPAGQPIPRLHGGFNGETIGDFAFVNDNAMVWNGREWEPAPVYSRDAGAHGEDEYAEIERRVLDLRNQYPNSKESVELHRRLVSYKAEPGYRERFQRALSMLKTVGFKTGRRTDDYY